MSEDSDLAAQHPQSAMSDLERATVILACMAGHERFYAASELHDLLMGVWPLDRPYAIEQLVFLERVRLVGRHQSGETTFVRSDDIDWRQVRHNFASLDPQAWRDVNSSLAVRSEWLSDAGLIAPYRSKTAQVIYNARLENTTPAVLALADIVQEFPLHIHEITETIRKELP